MRVWEKRYRVVMPLRSETGRRLYREGDINRLSLLKALVDRGHAIGSIADLDDDELERRVQQSAGVPRMSGTAEKPARRVDVAVIEWPGLQPDSVIEITRQADRLNARHLILVYDYAPRAALQRLAHDRVTALRSPLDLVALEAVVAWRFALAAHEFDDMAARV